MANRIHSVRDGAAALEFLFCQGAYAHRHPEHLPQLILLDLGLPKVSGLEVLRQIKSHPATKNISVVVLTVSMEDRDVEASRRLGADAYIVKPVDFRNLSAVTPSLQMQWALLKSIHSMSAMESTV
jgi:two-component system response regulator